MKTKQAIEWFKKTFNKHLQAVVRGTPFSVDMLAAIAQQETGYIWGTLDNYKKLGFPFSDTEHVMYRQKGMSDDKQPRQLMFGTTLMGADRTRSVVDADSRSHDHLNLFIVGSSVFPTASTANPTLTLAALALRTAEKIKNELAAA